MSPSIDNDVVNVPGHGMKGGRGALTYVRLFFGARGSTESPAKRSHALLFNSGISWQFSADVYPDVTA